MTAFQIYKIFIDNNPEMIREVDKYQEINGKPNSIKLYLSNNREAVFTVNKGKLDLVIEYK